MELLLLVCLCLLSCSGDGVRVVVQEGSDAVLPCFIGTKVDLEGELFDWRKVDSQKEKKEVFMYDAGRHYNNGLQGQDQQFKDRVSFFYNQLQNGNASIKITKTRMDDSGTYSCDFPRLQSQTFIIELVVGLAPEPDIDILDHKLVWALLQCEAHGVPPPTLKWKDSENNTLPAEEPQISDRGSRSYVAVKINVTKAGIYRCVATQETLSHQIAAVTSVHIQGPPPESGFSTGWIVAGVVLSLLLVVVAVPAVLSLKNRITQNLTTGSRPNTANGPTGAELGSPMI